MRVLGKVFVATGAGSGIGRELSLCLLSRGAHVAGVDLVSVAAKKGTSFAVER
jgi:NAD(P)-dependent dehydrogenase (short-subunit alcohol dehydrogenase family)